jgi:hypothetical protein
MVRGSSTSFYRRIFLPERADGSHIDARFEDGVLKVVIPFRELPSPETIAINSGRSTTQASASNQPPESQRQPPGQGAKGGEQP